MEPKTCEICGIKLGPYAKKYCSVKCAHIARYPKVELICKKCGKKFYTTPYKAKKFNPKYCSKECYGSAPNHTTAKCPVCEKEFIRYPYEIKRGIHIYCSIKCASITNEFREKHQGPASPLFKGGVRYEPYCYKFNEYFKERVRVFYDRKCAACGKLEKDNGEHLVVHHVITDKNTCCTTDLPLFVPLCRSCHGKTRGKNKGEWQKRFIKIIYEHTNGSMKCFLSKDEMMELVKLERQSATA